MLLIAFLDIYLAIDGNNLGLYRDHLLESGVHSRMIIYAVGLVSGILMSNEH